MNRKEKFKAALHLFMCFFRIGAFTFGGGYAMIPLIQTEVVEKKKWITDKDILDIIAISESTPGPISINAATFIGYKVCGFWGSFFSTFGLVLPSVVIISLLSMVLGLVENNKIVQYAFNGIRAGVLALIIKALISMYKQCPKNLFSYIVLALAFLVVAIFNINVIYVVIGCGVIGLVHSLIVTRRNEK